MKYLNILVIISILSCIGATYYYHVRVTEVNSDFSKNYWLHPQNPALAGSYTESIYTGKIISSEYEGNTLNITISNSKGQREFKLNDVIKDVYLTGLSSAADDMISVSVARYENGLEQIIDISFNESNAE